MKDQHRMCVLAAPICACTYLLSTDLQIWLSELHLSGIFLRYSLQLKCENFRFAPLFLGKED